MCWEFYERGFKQAARRGKWKYVMHAKSKKPMLFDFSKDVGEQENVAAKHPEIVASFEKWISTNRSESAHWPTTAAK